MGNPTNIYIDLYPDTVVDTTLYSYQSGAYLSVFDGLYILDTSGSYISDYGIGEEVHTAQHIFNINIDGNVLTSASTSLLTGLNTYYAVDIVDYTTGS